MKYFIVVNCFQKFISLIFGTIPPFAHPTAPCCELLSKVYIFDIRNNLFCIDDTKDAVVNCFQKFISLIFGTISPLIYSVFTSL